MSVWSIYIITNKVNGKQYVGMTKNIKRRWHQHISANGSAPALHAAIKKYGNDGFIYSYICDAFDFEAACDLEQVLIKQHNTKTPYGYNLTDGGEGVSGLPAWNKGAKATAEQIENNRLAHIGQVPWNKGAKSTEKHIENNRLGHIGQVAWNKGLKVGPVHSEEFKAKISAIHKGNKWRQGLPSSEKQKATASALSKGNTYAAGNTARRTWVWVGTNTITGEVVKYIGKKEMLEAGLQHSNIIKCINGKRKSHKGYTWTRELWSNI